MGFHEIQFPPEISYGSLMGPGFNTAIVEMGTGHEERVQRWGEGRHFYNAREGVKTQKQAFQIKEFYIARYGATHGFRWKDWLDYTTNIVDGVSAPTHTDERATATGDGSETQFQIVKRYASGSQSRIRVLNKPVDGTVLVGLDGVNQSSGWNVDLTTGLVTFTSAPGVGQVITFGCEFDVPVRFGAEVDEALLFSWDDFGKISTDVPVVEIFEDIVGPEEYYFGGSNTISFSDTLVLGLGHGRFLRLQPGGNQDVIIPAASLMPRGGPFFVIENESGNIITLKENTTGFPTIGTITANKFATLCVFDDGGNTWRRFITG